MGNEIVDQGPQILWYGSVALIVFLIASLLIVPWLRSVWPWYNRLFR